MADQHARVVIDGDSSGVARASGQAKDSVAQFTREIDKSKTALEQKRRAFDGTLGSLGKFGDGVKRLAPALGATSAAALTSKASLGSLASVALAAANAFGPLGLAIGIAGSALLGIIEDQNAAAEATRKHTLEIRKQAAEQRALAAAELQRKTFSFRAGVEQKKFLEREGLGDLQKELREVENAIAIAKGSGANAVGFEKERTRLQAESLRLQARSLEITSKALTLDEVKAQFAQRDALLEEATNLEREQELRLLEKGAEVEKGRTREKEKQKELMSAALFAELQRVGAMQRRAEAEAKLRVKQDDEAFAALGGQFDDARQQFEEDKIARLDAAREAAHEAQLARIEAEKQAEEDRVRVIENATQVGEQAANTAVFGLISIREARKQAIQAAKLQGKTDAEAARMGKIAALEQTASVLKNIRDQAGAKALFETAEAIAAFARYDIPGGIQHTIAAGVYGSIALGTGLGAMAVGNRADSLALSESQGGGFGGGFGPGAGSGGGGSSSPRSGPSPIDSHIPGSPSPSSQNAGGSSSSSGGNKVVDLRGSTFNMYGAGGRDEFIRDIDRDLGDLGHQQRRRSA